MFCEKEKHAPPNEEEELLKKYLEYAFNELLDELTDEQVNRVLNPVLEKIRGETI